jgi:eukaryotic-like serine/threonine-protein kinase
MVADAPAGRTRQGELLGGKYLLEKRLGSGGMGDVWKARNVAVGRDVAIKLLRPEHADNPSVAARFVLEARTANLVRHPNVVDVLDVGHDDAGAPYLVQELLVGRDLSQYAAECGGRLRVDAAMRILLSVVDAVAFAHAKGVVHRDLKPENVFLAREGDRLVPKLLDFGISQVESGPRMTATGVALGTPAYMAPEQIKGTRHVDTRSDVWALGVMIHEVLAGELPFHGETSADMFVQIATATPTPLEEAVPGVPIEIAHVVAKCLRRNPEERYGDARDLLRDLRAIAGPEHVQPLVAPTDPPPPPSFDIAHAIHAPPKSARAAARDLVSTADDVGALSPRAPLALGGFVDLAPAPTHAPALQVESRPPHGRFAKVRSSFRPTANDADARRPLTALALAIAALVAGGALTLVNPWPEGWGVAQLLSLVLGALPDLVGRVLAAGLLVLAVLTAVRGARMSPVSIAYFVAALGIGAVGGVLLALGAAAGPPLAWAAALGSFGGAAVAMRHATDEWLEDLRSSAVFVLVVATVLLFAAAQIIRGQG